MQYNYIKIDFLLLRRNLILWVFDHVRSRIIQSVTERKKDAGERTVPLKTESDKEFEMPLRIPACKLP